MNVDGLSNLLFPTGVHGIPPDLAGKEIHLNGFTISLWRYFNTDLEFTGHVLKASLTSFSFLYFTQDARSALETLQAAGTPIIWQSNSGVLPINPSVFFLLAAQAKESTSKREPPPIRNPRRKHRVY
jgi:hypothetical protein